LERWGTIFGSRASDYSFSIPKKMKRAALRAALSLRCQEGKLILLDDFPLEGFKTRQVMEVLRRFQVEDALIVTDGKRPFLERSARNIPKIKVLRYEKPQCLRHLESRTPDFTESSGSKDSRSACSMKEAQKIIRRPLVTKRALTRRRPGQRNTPSRSIGMRNKIEIQKPLSACSR